MAKIQLGRELVEGRDLPIGQRITLPGHIPEPVTLEAVRPIGAGFECRIRLPDGTPDEAILSADEARLLFRQATTGSAQVTPADADKLRLLIESSRIRLAYTHDRHFAVSLSGIRTLPHQIEAVYMKMLPQPRLRFLLADDPGAGKTVMAGLFIKANAVLGSMLAIGMLAMALAGLNSVGQHHGATEVVSSGTALR
jgi:hypothetical protein